MRGGNEDVEMTDYTHAWKAGDTVRVKTENPERWLSYGQALSDDSRPIVTVRHAWPGSAGDQRWQVIAYPREHLEKSSGPPEGAEFGPDVYQKPVTVSGLTAMRSLAHGPLAGVIGR